ncbi:gliding motility lipoprotein GldD [Tenacibaculum caenipelagi]|uniref:Protein involved in gliding motility GldD n=1 Tax=Tenacibaculum caenipelagi TaxID=1325435 RepID=A0A4R6TG00_9FLAO|nr:gliding motility lipoprotein GldD [Tenacibaculum caenipelagi]TDQ28763.1 protein involved in gliding motility GldD [Tenacibaculum caenipelagi]
MRKLFLLVSAIFLISCGEEMLPKPKGYLSLEYPEKTYKRIMLHKPYSFETAQITQSKDLPKNWMNVEYPTLKASVDITYRPIEGNLRELLMESEKLVFEHAIKADQITAPVEYANPDKKVYGSVYQILGNAASQVQFHATDSSKHFLKGSLFFYTKPNYDSILPAVEYIKNDMIHMMETLEWK